jgi:glycosyltransferase involved in cell wall biosynthesis
MRLEDLVGDYMQESAARVLVTCATFEPGFRGGGPVRSVAQIIDSAPPDLDILLVTRDRDLGSDEPYAGLSGHWIPRGNAKVFYLNTNSVFQWLCLIAELRRGRITLMYLNSLFQPQFSILPLILCVLRILPVNAVLLAPRGELSPGALSLKARKKRWFLRIWRPLLLHSNLTWHASSEMEADHIRAIVESAHITIAVSSDQSVPPISSTDLPRAQYLSPRFVYIGRISQKKNLRLAIAAFEWVTTPAAFDIYGPIEDKRYWESCKEGIAALPTHISVRYRGELTPDRVLPTFSLYDAFVFPTLGENFGHVIAESLASSCPVICSDQTPWTPVLEADGGRVLRDLTPEALGAVLAEFAAMSSTAIDDARSAALRAFREWSARQDRSNVLSLVLRQS